MVYQIAAGLVHQAVCNWLRAYMMTMEDIMGIIKTKELSPSAMTAYNKLLRAHLVAIDDIMLFSINKQYSVGFFNLINALHEKTSVIITTNKAPTEWAATLDDEVLASALLDRLLYHCEIIKLSGQSCRMGNLKSIFENDPSWGYSATSPILLKKLVAVGIMYCVLRVITLDKDNILWLRKEKIRLMIHSWAMDCRGRKTT